MDEWGDDAYGVIYDEHDRERDSKPSNVNASPSYCCPILIVFAVIGFVIAILL